MINPANLLKLAGMKNKFNESHPKFGKFLKAVGRDSLVEGTIITIGVQAPGKDEIVTNLKVNASDMEMIEEIKQLVK